MTGAPRERAPVPLPLVAWLLVRDAAANFGKDDAPRHGAALAYYALFSVAPLLLLATSIAGLLYDEAVARAEVSARLLDLLGPEGASAVESLLDRALPRGSGIVSTIIGIVTTLFGASTVFVQLRGSFDHIWKVRPPPGKGVYAFLCGRALGAGMVLLTGGLLLASLALGAVVRAGGEAIALWIGWEHEQLDFVWRAVSFGLVTFTFAGLFKLLPSVKLTWTDVLPAALVTAALFTLGRVLIGLYLARTGISSAYGAAGSLVAFLVWVFISAQILLFGAELTRAWALRVGSRRGRGQPKPDPTRTPP